MANGDTSRCELVHEAFANAADASAEANAAVALDLWESIARQFEPLIGSGSVVLIFARSIELNKSRFPWLTLIPQAYAAPMTFASHATDLRLQPAAEIEDASCALIKTFAELLDQLIGVRLSGFFIRRALTAPARSDSSDSPQGHPP